MWVRELAGWCVGEETGRVVCMGEGTGRVVCGRGNWEGGVWVVCG